MAEVDFEIRDNVARITFNRPEVMNAVRNENYAKIGERLETIEFDPAVRCVVFAGKGPNFCSGGDVNEFGASLDLPPQERAKYWMTLDRQVARLFLVLERMPQPVVVSMRGFAAGGGMGLVGAADLVIASETSRFVVAQINIGAIPDTQLSYSLLQVAGLRKAKQYCLLGEPFDAQAALAMDLVNWVVPDSELEARTEELVARLVRAPRVAAGLTKASLNRAHRIALTEHSEQQTIDVGACVVDPEFGERVRKFLDKSKRR